MTTTWLRSTPASASLSSSGANMGISLLFAPTSTWPTTRVFSWVAAASRCTWLPWASVAPRTVLPSTAIATSPDARSDSPAVADSAPPEGRAVACSANQAPMAASTAAASAPVTTRQMVAFDGGSQHRL